MAAAGTCGSLTVTAQSPPPPFVDERRLPTASTGQDQSGAPGLEATRNIAREMLEKLERDAAAMRERMALEAAEHRRRLDDEATALRSRLEIQRGQLADPEPDIARRRRLAAEAERQADEARRAAAEVEARRQAEQENERQRLAAEAERRADEARRAAAEVEARRQAEQEAERRRLAAEAERQADEARRTAAEVEARRQAEQENERRRLAAEAERRAEEARRTAAEADEAQRRQQAAAEVQRQLWETRRGAAQQAPAAAPARRLGSQLSQPAPSGSAAEGGLVVEGVYSTHVRPACGEPFQSVLVDIAAGRVKFDHLFRGVPHTWTGAIDAAGAIRAASTVDPSFRAEGSLVGQRIELAIPACGATPIVMQIRWRTKAGER